MPTLTVEQSKNGAKRSVEVRRSNALELQRLRSRVHELESALPAKPQAEQQQNPSEILTRTREHIDSIDKLISDCTDAKEMDALTRSREREWRIFAHLSNLPGPGNLKPSQPRQNTRKELPPPTVAQAQPSAAQGSAEPQQGQAGQG